MRDMKGQGSVQAILPLAVIPIALIIAVLIFGTTSSTLRTSDIFSGPSGNESLGSLGASPTTLNTDNKYVDLTTLRMWRTYTDQGGGMSKEIYQNGSTGCSGICWTAREETGPQLVHSAEVMIYSNASNASYVVNGSYTYYEATSAASSLTTVETNSGSGFNLASILPIIIAAVVIIGVVLGALALRR